MTDDDYGPYGDSASNVDAALLEHTLRQLLTDITDQPPADADVPAEVTAQIHDAVRLAWPDGHPPTLDELPDDLESYPEGIHIHELDTDLAAHDVPAGEYDVAAHPGLEGEPHVVPPGPFDDHGHLGDQTDIPDDGLS
jgi:hypothetical protein